MALTVPPFIVMARTCSCAPCAAAVAGVPGESPYVTGHRGGGAWSCVYCGGPATRHSGLALVVWDSICSWVGQVWWEIKVGRYLG